VAFSDGVFAVAATLLALDLHVPSAGPHLLTRLGHEWPTYLAFTISFLRVLSMWKVHREVWREIPRTNPLLDWLNGTALFLVVLQPFVASLLAENMRSSTGGRIALLIYVVHAIAMVTAITAPRNHLILHPDVKSFWGGHISRTAVRLLSAYRLLTYLPVLIVGFLVSPAAGTATLLLQAVLAWYVPFNYVPVLRRHLPQDVLEQSPEQRRSEGEAEASTLT
jgi:uncharacterized membrane protein